jgi:hypothetical protein
VPALGKYFVVIGVVALLFESTVFVQKNSDMALRHGVNFPVKDHQILKPGTAVALK